MIFSINRAACETNLEKKMMRHIRTKQHLLDESGSTLAHSVKCSDRLKQQLYAHSPSIMLYNELMLLHNDTELFIEIFGA